MKVPLIFGCVGHIDIEENDELREKVRSIFLKYMSKYKNSDFYLITSLAEGADLLVSEVANELGIFLHIILPYDEKEYLQTFKNSNNINRYYKLKSVAKKFEIIKYNSEKKEDLYFEAAKRMVTLSNIIISLWDKKFNNKKGGTSSIIKYLENKNLNDNLLKILYIIETPRLKDNVEKKYDIEKKEYKMFSKNGIYNIFKYIDDLNKNVNNVNFNFFDKLAIKYQKLYYIVSLLILFFVFIGVVAYEYNTDFNFKLITTFIYILMVVLSYVIYYYFIKLKKINEKFLLSRFIAECLRIQSNFNYLNINKNISEMIFFDDIIKFNWIKVLINNIAYLSYIKNDFFVTPKVWVKNQIDYFDDAIKKREKKIRIIKNIENFFKLLGIIVIIILLGAVFIYNFFDLNILNLPFSIMIFLSAFFFTIYIFLEEYLKILQYKEEIYNFKLMKKIYINYEKHYSNIDETDLVIELSKKAVDEIVRWFEFHYNSVIKIKFY